MKSALYILLLLLLNFSLFSQTDQRIAKTKTPLPEAEQIVMPYLDNAALLQTEMARRAPGIAPRFAENTEVDISPDNHGQWEYLSNGNAVWRLRIYSKGAKSLNLGFTKYLMPRGGTLVLYSPDYAHIMGPFTPADNEEHEQLWTPVLPGDELVIEVQLPKEAVALLQLQLKYVNHDFLGFADMMSGSCNLDAICGEADGWAIVDAYRDIIQSVAVISVSGSLSCTGFLVNNARQDCTPLFMTASHCGVNESSSPSLIAYWNYQNSTCRQPGSPASGISGNGVLNTFNTGAVFKAGWSDTDFTLVELDDTIPAAASAFFAGWSAENFAPADTVLCIHHPNSEEKRISFEFNSTNIGFWPGNNNDPGGNHIIIPGWDTGTTEDGSSGGPLFNKQKRVVGQLHGGEALCGNNLYDSFGWFHSSWEGGGTPATRLRDWLDPDNTGIVVLDGRSQMQCSFFVDGTPANINLCTPEDAEYTIAVSGNFTDSVMLSLSGLPGSLAAVFETNPVPPGGSTVLTISNTGALGDGFYSFTVSGTDGTETNSSQLSVQIASQPPSPPALTFPGDGETGIGLSVNYSWAALPGTTYTIEIATYPAFANIVESAANLTGGTYQSNVALIPFGTYYWRVRGENICGQGAWAEVFSFMTGTISCTPLASADVPKPVSSSGTPIVTSTLNITSGGFIDDINVINLNTSHSWVGDLRIELKSPEGTIVPLMSNPGGGDCEENNISVEFDDQAADAYSVLDGMCDPGVLAISGIFQPLQPLAAFNGEWSEGLWTLTVYDDSNLDGGSLNSWGLNICSTAPDDFSVSPSTEEIESCVDGESSFTVLLGTAFDLPTGVTMTAENLPPGASATFTPNPGAPGQQITVTVSGATVPGNFTFDITGSDGTNTGNAQIQWSVIGIPGPPTPIAPAQFATSVSLNPNMSWTAVSGAFYSVKISTDSGLNDIVFSGTTSNSFIQAQGLDYCTHYYWVVSAINDCGESALEVFTFTTLPDLTFDATPASLTSCNTGNANTILKLGSCFESAGVMLTASGLPPGASLTFSNNPAQAGTEVTIEIVNDNATPGSYTITINGTDGTNMVSETFNLTIIGPAAAPVLVFPANNATGVAVKPAFDWNPVSGAVNYKFELATDANFTSVITDISTVQTAWTPTVPLEHLTTHYWRVTAFNNCGGTVPAPFSFTTEPVNAVMELNGLGVSIQPNPASDVLLVKFSEPLREPTDLVLFAVNGVRLQQQRLMPGQQEAKLDLSVYSAGVYLLKLVAAQAVVTEKIILE